MQKQYTLYDTITQRVVCSQHFEEGQQPSNATDVPCISTFVDMRFNPSTQQYYEGANQTQVDAYDEEIEHQKYLIRKDEGLDTYLKFAGRLRTARNKGRITQNQYVNIEVALKSVRDELIVGQIVTAKANLVVVGTGVIGVNLYNDIMAVLDAMITRLY